MTSPAGQPALLSPGDLCRERFRQIHLDFHTSPHIPDVGAEFNADEFAQTLADARVNWVTLFGKCHHGMSYYPTTAGVMHPGLHFDLLGAQIEACRRKDIVTPVYISVRVDQHTAETHPGFIGWTAEEKVAHWPDANGAGWYNLCPSNAEYVDYLIAQAYEILRAYDAEGFFFDMCYFIDCHCPNCQRRVAAAGGKWNDPVDVRRKEYELTREYTQRIATAVREVKPNATLFFNSRVNPYVANELDILTHLEIESLPTGGWGYQYFPFHVRYGRTLGYPTQGMTARFHKSWADFGGLKTTTQMEYEAGITLASGSVMNVGDQLHPRGRLDNAAYKVIGHAFTHVEAREPWCRNAETLAEVGVVMLNDRPEMPLEPTQGAEGAAAMLLELKYQFDVVVPGTDLRKYKLLILPDSGLLDAERLAKLTQYIEQGGSILLSYKATLDPATQAFQCPGLPVAYAGDFPFTPCYTRPGEVLGAALPDGSYDYVLYDGAAQVTVAAGAETLGNLATSYFNRAHEHFSSHAQTPVDKQTGDPLLVRRGNVFYLAAPLFKGYRTSNYIAYKHLVKTILEMAVPQPLLRAKAPSAMEISLTRQPAENRVITHLINYQPQRRQTAIEYIDEAWPVQQVKLALRNDVDPTSVYLAPEGTALPFTRDGAYVRTTVPEMLTHAMVVWEF